MQDSQMLLEVVRLILPEEFLTYFKITKVTKVKDVITIFMDEFDTLSAELKGHKVESKGFLGSVHILGDLTIKHIASLLYTDRT